MAANDIVARYVLSFHDQASRGIIGVSNAARGMAASLAAGVGAATAFQSAMQFQTMLTDIEQKADGGAAAVAGLGEKLQAVAIRSGQLPVEAAKAYDALLGLGADTKTADALVEPILRAATAYRASADDISKASFSLTDTLKVPAAQAGQAIDIMALAAKEGKIELRDMAQSIPSLAASFATLGARGTEAVASLAAGLEIVGKAAGSPEEAATNFQNLLSKIDSKETRDRFTKLGVNLPEELKKRTAAGEDIIEAFLGELKELEAKGVNIKDVVSDQQAGLALSAINQNMAEYIALRDKAKGAGGVVDADFARRMNDFEPKLRQFMALLQTLAIQIGGPILNALNPILKFITDFASANPGLTLSLIQLSVGFFGVNKALSVLGGTWTGVIGKIAGSRGLGLLVNGMMRIGPIIKGIGPMVARIIPFLISLGPAFAGAATAAWGFAAALLANPITWIVAGIAALAAGVYLIIKNWSVIGPWLASMWAVIRGHFLNGIAFFVSLHAQMAQIGLQLMQGIANGIMNGAKWAYDAIVSVAAGIKNKIAAFFGIASPSRLFAEFGNFLVQGLAGGISASASLAEAAARGLSDGVNAQLQPNLGLSGFGDLGSLSRDAAQGRIQASQSLNFAHEHRWIGLPVEAQVQTVTLPNQVRATPNNGPRRPNTAFG